MPAEGADAPTVRVSQMTRAHLREVLTVFLGTGTCDDSGREYSAPFHHQGTGTVNTLVLTLLSMIAELRQNVIFAMEEPEIAIPPHTQKRVINSVISKSAQAIFTSHSPYVLEEFNPEYILVISREQGVLEGVPSQYPPTVKSKNYRDEIKRRFCEAFLARRVLIVEGKTEYDTFSRLAEKLHKLKPDEYAPLEGLGIAVISADSDSQVSELARYFKGLGKTTYAIFDKQTHDASEKIVKQVDYPYESPEQGIENTVVKGINEDALRRYAAGLISCGQWPQHLASPRPDSADEKELRNAMFDFFRSKKADGAIADCLEMCSPEKMPQYILNTLKAICDTVMSPPIAVGKDDAESGSEANSTSDVSE
jgi:putative ATP-dependent endonuclease of OLD family